MWFKFWKYLLKEIYNSFFFRSVAVKNSNALSCLWNRVWKQWLKKFQKRWKTRYVSFKVIFLASNNNCNYQISYCNSNLIWNERIKNLLTRYKHETSCALVVSNLLNYEFSKPYNCSKIDNKVQKKSIISFVFVRKKIKVLKKKNNTEHKFSVTFFKQRDYSCQSKTRTFRLSPRVY